MLGHGAVGKERDGQQRNKDADHEQSFLVG